MNILFVTYHTCARAAKEAFALINAGHQVIILQHVATSEDILYTSEICAFYRADPQSLASKVRHFSEWADVIHVHNEPSWIVSCAAAERDISCPEVPVVFDVHDLQSMREDGEVDPDETAAIHAADGFIFPSRGYETGISASRNISGNPGRVIYSFCCKGDIVQNPLPRVSGVVYEGGLVAPLINFNNKTSGYKSYRDYTTLSAQFTIFSIPFHLYGCRPEFQERYLRDGAIVHDYHRFGVMMRQLSRYDWGLCGHLENHPQWQKAMPNKLFEYIAAGIPVLSINAGEVSEFVEHHGVGVAAKSMSHLASLAKDARLRNDLADAVEDKQSAFVMESQVAEIEGVYAEAADYRKSRLDAGVLRSGDAGKKACGSWVCFDQLQSDATDNICCDKSVPALRGNTEGDQEAAQRELYP
jgi:hypothetical protein